MEPVTVRSGRRQKSPVRTCIVTRRSGAPEAMIRFVVAPDGTVVPDLARRLPGRGAWVIGERLTVERAVRAFRRAFKADVTAPDDLADRLEGLLADRALSRLAMANKAGHVTCGFEKVRARLSAGDVSALVMASDAALDGVAKLTALAKHVPRVHNAEQVVRLFSSQTLERALGRDRVVHVALSPGRPTELFLTDAARLRRYTHGATIDGETTPAATQPDELVGPKDV